MRSLRSVLGALALGAGLAVQAQEHGLRADAAGAVRLLVQSSPLAGFRYGEAAAIWPLLRAGHALELVREPDNPFDANAVRVEWRGHKLGYVPRRDNAALAWGMDRGMALRARVSRLTEHRNPAKRIEFEVFAE
jgi:hypothetical protein